MELLLAFAAVLVVAALLSERLHASVLSTALLFLLAGVLLGRGGLGLVPVDPGSPQVVGLATLALYSVLFTDGMHAGRGELRGAWALPGRALLVGMPLSFGLAAVALLAVSDLGVKEALLVAAVLTPTDPVFAASLVGRVEVPQRLRHLLNVESGLNDGLALPVVLVLLSLVSSSGSSVPRVLGELALGVAIGVVVPLVVLRVERMAAFGPSVRYAPLTAFAIGLLVFALCEVSSANPFLAAFAAGSTVATVSPRVRADFTEFGELVTELFKLAALLVFGALLTRDLATGAGFAAYGFAVLLLLVVRPVSVLLALLGSRMDRLEQLSAAWFGPKGFASVTYGLFVLQSDARRGPEMFAFIAIAVTLSIIAHSTTDTVVARAFVRRGVDA